MKKIVILIGVLVLLVIGACNLLVSCLPDPCGSTWLADVVSPNQALRAVIFEGDCGATTDFATQVSIVSSRASLKDTGKSFFAADTNRSRAPAGPGGGPEVQVRWLSDTRLQVQYHWAARVIQAKTNVEGVEIEYGTFQ